MITSQEFDESMEGKAHILEGSDTDETLCGAESLLIADETTPASEICHECSGRRDSMRKP